MGMSFLTASTFSSAMWSRRWASLRASFCSVSKMASLPCWEILRRYSSVRAIIMASCRRLTCICQYESWSRSSQSRILFSSMSTPLRAFRASSVKVTSATRKSFRDSIDRTFADWAMGCVLEWPLATSCSSLLQILVRTIGLAHQEWNVLVGRIDEALDNLHRLLEFFDKFVVLAVAPGLAKAGDLTVEHGQLVHEI